MTPDESAKVLEACAAMSQALQPLSPEQRKRVLCALLVLFNETGVLP